MQPTDLKRSTHLIINNLKCLLLLRFIILRMEGGGEGEVVVWTVSRGISHLLLTWDSPYSRDQDLALIHIPDCMTLPPSFPK